MNSFKETKTERISANTTKRHSEARSSNKTRPERSGLNSTSNKSGGGPNHQGSMANLKKGSTDAKDAKEALDKRRLEKQAAE